jgi:hypothetical protein
MLHSFHVESTYFGRRPSSRQQEVSIYLKSNYFIISKLIPWSKNATEEHEPAACC